MNKRIVQALALLIFAAPLASAASGIPDQIQSMDKQRVAPIWVSARSAIVDGHLDESKFSEFELSGLNETLQASAGPKSLDKSVDLSKPGHEFDDCNSWTFVSGQSGPQKDMEQLFADSAISFVGTVRSIETGFYHGFLVSLLEVDIDESLRFPGDSEQPASVYVVFMNAKLQLADKLICTKTGSYPLRPTVGGRILILTQSTSDAQPLIVAPTYREMFFETRSGHAYLPGNERALDQPD